MYGIWNRVTDRFVFGISERSKKEAWDKFTSSYIRKYIPYRYVVREIPEGFVNPPNHVYVK